jgi:hypothetical protein
MNEFEKWCFMKVKCTDGVTRLGINMEDETMDEDIIEGGFHYEYIVTITQMKADDLGMEVYDNTDPNYDGII